MEKTPLTSFVHDSITRTIEDHNSDTIGRLLTLIEAVIPDKDQRKAVKDMLRQAFYNHNWYDNVNLVCSIVYDELHTAGDKGETYPWWHKKKDESPIPVEWGNPLDVTR